LSVAIPILSIIYSIAVETLIQLGLNRIARTIAQITDCTVVEHVFKDHSIKTYNKFAVYYDY